MRLLSALLIVTLLGTPALANEKTQVSLSKGKPAPFSGILLSEELYRSFVLSKENELSLTKTVESLNDSLEKEKAGRAEDGVSSRSILAVKDTEILSLRSSLTDCLELAKKPIVVTEEPGLLDSPVFWGIVGVVAGGVVGTLITLEIKD